MVFRQRFEGNRLNYAIEWQKSTPSRGKDQCKDLIMRVCLFKEQQEACIVGGEWVEWNVVWLKVRIVTGVQYPEGYGRPL